MFRHPRSRIRRSPTHQTRLVTAGPVVAWTVAALSLLSAWSGLSFPARALSDGRSPDTAAPRVEIPNARTPGPGVLTGGQPTAEQIQELAAAGYRTIVNLRTEGESEISDHEGELVHELGLRYVSLPIAGAGGLTDDKVRRLAEVLEDQSSRPVVVHCASGNRVGALFALKAFFLDGTDAATALEIGRDAGLTRLEPVVREKLEGAEKHP